MLKIKIDVCTFFGKSLFQGLISSLGGKDIGTYIGQYVSGITGSMLMDMGENVTF